MKSPSRLFLCAGFCVAATLYDADRTNFSGTYSLTPRKESRTPVNVAIKKLTVVQTENSIEMTEVEEGHTNTHHYPLSGQDGIYINPNGVKGTCRGKLRKNDLVLESFVTTRPDPNGPLVQMHTKQKWELSPDLKTLRIHVDVDSPQSPINVIEPWTDIYTRD